MISTFLAKKVHLTSNQTPIIRFLYCYIDLHPIFIQNNFKASYLYIHMTYINNKTKIKSDNE